MAAFFIESTVSTLDAHAPLISHRKHSRRPCPWATAELITMVRERNKLHRLLMRDKTNAEIRNQHRSARAGARKLDRKLKEKYFTQQCRTNDQRKLWRAMNTVTGRCKQSSAPQAPLPELSRVFGEVVRDANRPDHLRPCIGPVPSNGFTGFSEVSVEDVASCLRSVDPAKATGSDSVPGIVLNKCSTVLAQPLTTIINTSMSSGEIPSSFKISHISPLYKSGDPLSAMNYRPVSLLPIVSRILEFFVKQQLTDFLEREHLIPESQFASKPVVIS